MFDVIKHGLPFVLKKKKKSYTKAMFNLDDLKWENIQKNMTFSEHLSKKHKEVKNCHALKQICLPQAHSSSNVFWH